MRRFILVLVLVAVVAQAARLPTRPRSALPIVPRGPGAPTYPSPRIVNGQRATRGQFPHQAAVLIDNRAFCGGSLISTEWILTTARYCVLGASSWQVTLGQQRRGANEAGTITLQANTGILHENFDASSLSNDIALLRLPSAVEFTEYIQPIALPSRSDVGNTLVGLELVASGWGRGGGLSFTDQLKWASFVVITNQECARTYGDLIDDTKLCVATERGGQTTSSSDTGGPLIGNATLRGCTSFGSEAGSPAGFTRVTSYLDWIEQTTGVAIR